MQTDYYIAGGKGEIDLATVADRLARMAQLLTPAEPTEHNVKKVGRNLWTRNLDRAFRFTNRYVWPLHWLGLTVTALAFYIYARLVGLTARLVTSGEASWPNLQAPSVVALWHGDAPSLLIAFTMRRTKAPAAILISSDPRGDCMALLCRMLGFEVVRTSGKHGDWNALIDLAEKMRQGASVIITADGGGPAKAAKLGAVALASAAGVPLVPLAANTHPALQQSHKWDAARNPLPFSTVTVWLGVPRRFELFLDRESIEGARKWLEETLNKNARRV